MEANVMCARGACLNRRDYPSPYCADHTLDDEPLQGAITDLGLAVDRADLDVAIGEHAFGAGYRACYEDFMSAKLNAGHKLEECLHDAWSAYDPAEELKGG